MTYNTLDEFDHHTLKLRSGSDRKKRPDPHSNLIVHKKLWSFKVAGGDSDVVLLSWVVKLGQTPVNKTQLQSEANREWKVGNQLRTKKIHNSSNNKTGLFCIGVQTVIVFIIHLAVFMIDHHVMWLHISVHDSHTVAVVQGLEETAK